MFIYNTLYYFVLMTLTLNAGDVTPEACFESMLITSGPYVESLTIGDSDAVDTGVL